MCPYISEIDKSVDLEYFKKDIYSKAKIRLINNPLLFLKISTKYILKRLKLFSSKFIPIKFTPKIVSGLVVKTSIFLLSFSRINIIEAPFDFPIQFFCISLIESDQSIVSNPEISLSA